MKALPRTGRLSRLQADPFKKFTIKNRRDGQDKIKQETKSLINIEYEKSSIEFENKSITSLEEGSVEGSGVNIAVGKVTSKDKKNEKEIFSDFT